MTETTTLTPETETPPDLCITSILACGVRQEVFIFDGADHGQQRIWLKQETIREGKRKRQFEELDVPPLRIEFQGCLDYRHGLLQKLKLSLFFKQPDDQLNLQFEYDKLVTPRTWGDPDSGYFVTAVDTGRHGVWRPEPGIAGPSLGPDASQIMTRTPHTVDVFSLLPRRIGWDGLAKINNKITEFEVPVPASIVKTC